MQSSVLEILYQDRPFHLVCNTSDFAIGCAFIQYDRDSNERVVFYRLRWLQAFDRSYPLHDKKLRAIQNALAQFRLDLSKIDCFIVCTNYVSLSKAHSYTSHST